MPKVTFKRDFKFAEGGWNIKSYIAGQTITVSPDCAKAARQEDVLDLDQGKTPVSKTQKKTAPPSLKDRVLTLFGKGAPSSSPPEGQA